MNSNNNLTMDNNHNYEAGNGFSLLVGFVLAFTNSVFGWLGNISITANIDAWFQALILGVIGSTATFFTNKFWKYVVEKRKTKKTKQ